MSYSAIYIRAFRSLMDIEGWSAFSDHAADAGGKTKYGISQLAYPDEDIANLTEERAMFLYKRDWWDCLRLDAIRDEGICFQLFESAVHMDAPGRPHRSVKIAQAALRIHGVNVTFDGAIGPQTLGALNNYPHKASLLKWMNLIQGAALMVGADGEDELIESVKKRLSQLQTFGRGWGRRIEL